MSWIRRFGRTWILNRLYTLNYIHLPRCSFTTDAINPENIRNIGILAHIDAGKTTTTERMLFYSGRTAYMGEVDHGNTVTDYLAQERERGITVCSSAVTMAWNHKKINLLDTPGHIDFTMEVEQSLHAVDGVIIILDGTAGVEAQTITVCSQAARHYLPKVFFINKMDRPDADFDKAVKDIQTQLNMQPICIQYPHKDAAGNLAIFDIIKLEYMLWNADSNGRDFTSTPITDKYILKQMQERRYNLIDELCGVDDELAHTVIHNDGFDEVNDDMIYAGLRRATFELKVVPVLLGSAYKNIGIQKLMDAVVDFLPAPHERSHIYKFFNDDVVGKVFKIVHDKQRGALTLVRVLNGEIKKGMRLTCTEKPAEIVGKIYEPLADEYKEVNSAAIGDVVLCSGLKHTVTGDLLFSSNISLRNAEERLKNYMDTNQDVLLLNTIDDSNKSTLYENLTSELLALKPQIPDAVYFCSIEPPNTSVQVALDTALLQLQREDPSLRVNYDPVTGQTILGGMGELHMDIIKSRILTEYKIDADLGALQIAYKETLEEPGDTVLSIGKDIAGSKQMVQIEVELLKNAKELFSLDKSPENADNLKALHPKTLKIIRKGCLSALQHGPKVGGEVVDTQIKLLNVIIGRGTADSFLLAVAAQSVQKVLKEKGTRLLEPIMSLQILVKDNLLSSVLCDLARRRATINDVIPRGSYHKVILANAPLAELYKYSTVLRTITSGSAVLTMQPNGFANMNPKDESTALQRAQGLA